MSTYCSRNSRGIIITVVVRSASILLETMLYLRTPMTTAAPAPLRAASAVLRTTVLTKYACTHVLLRTVHTLPVVFLFPLA